MKYYLASSFLTLILILVLSFYPSKGTLFMVALISFMIPAFIIFFNDRNIGKRYP